MCKKILVHRFEKFAISFKGERYYGSLKWKLGMRIWKGGLIHSIEKTVF